MKHTLLFLLLLFGVTLHAQDVFELEEFIADETVWAMTYSHDNAIMALTFSPQRCAALKKYDDNGVLLDSVFLWPHSEKFVKCAMFSSPNGQTLVYHLQVHGDTATFHKATIGDDMIPVFEDYDWYGLDCPGPETLPTTKLCHVVVNKDGGCFLSYTTAHDSIRMVRFDAGGMVLAERTIDRHPYLSKGHGCVPTSDSLGIHIIKWRTDTTAAIVYGCYTFDSTLNLAHRVDDLDATSKPVYCNHNAFYRFNPNTGKTYSVTCSSDPVNYNGQNIVMSMFDEDMNQLKYTWGIINPHIADIGGYDNSIDFDSENRVYVAGGMEKGSNPYIACLDEDLNKLGEIHFVEPGMQIPLCILALPKGGCLLSCAASGNYRCVYKVTISDFLNVEEAHSHGSIEAVAYPNPAQDELHLEFSPDVTPTQIELFDLQGRLVKTQRNGLESLNLQGLAPGAYTMRVTLEGGKVFSDKVVKE